MSLLWIVILLIPTISSVKVPLTPSQNPIFNLSKLIEDPNSLPNRFIGFFNAKSRESQDMISNLLSTRVEPLSVHISSNNEVPSNIFHYWPMDLLIFFFDLYAAEVGHT
jgi:hypothetical protein